MDTIPGLNLSDLQNANRILAIQPHYDDNDIAAGGSLLSLARAGIEIIYLTVTDDLAGVIHQNLTPAEAEQSLIDDQTHAAALLGVQDQIRLGFPDGGRYDYFALRSALINQIQIIQPDFIFTVDPWTPYEAHHDHLMTGKATAEAAILYSLPAFGDHPAVIKEYYALSGVVFYNTAYPNQTFDITPVIHEKQQLLRSYQAQFTPDGLETLVMQTTALAAYVALDKPFEYGEALKIIPPWMLHGVSLTIHL